MANDKKPILLVDVGRAVVYHYVYGSDWLYNHQPTAVYWRLKNSHIEYGPFTSIYAAVESWKLTEEELKNPKVNNVIEVDFKAKKRLR